ncbi:MAG: ATP-binding protein [Planctomycetota bacterium]|nr:ATP-binding protein [Planctomycetota bacterium]
MNAWVFLAIGLVVGAGAMGVGASAYLRRHLRRVREAERRARGAERLAEIGAMTGGLAHEIKNPLSTIGLNAQLLGEAIGDLPIDAEEKGRLDRRIGSLRREVDRLRGILQDFLEYAGELRLDRRPADLNTVVEELVDFFIPQAQKKGVRLMADLKAQPAACSIDVPHVKQAVLNLMLNAVEAMSGRGDGPLAPTTTPRELILRTERAASGTGTPLLRLHVIDTGPGIAPEALEKIFRPYFTTKSGGSGLGLPTTRRIVEAHDGRIDVHTAVGQGTDFVLSFPAS